MTQARIYDFGALLTQGRAKALSSKLLAPGVYEGLEPLVVSDPLLRLSAGAYMLPNGVLVVESTDVDIEPPVVTSAADYTLTADHDDIQAVGGSPVTYTWRSGLLPRSGSPNTNSLAILWLRHPGSATLDLSMLSLPMPVKNSEGIGSFEATQAWLQAPFGQATDVYRGPNITALAASHTAGAEHLGLRITNSAPTGLQGYQCRLPLPLIPRARSIEVYATLPNLATLKVSSAPLAGNTVTAHNYQVFTEAGGAVTTSPAVLTGPVTSLATPAATFSLTSTESPPRTFGVTIEVPPGSAGVFLKGFKVIGD